MKGRPSPTGQSQPVPGAGDVRFIALQAEVLRALGHPVRLQILEMLRDGEHCVCEFEPALGLRQPNISQHLSVLRSANLVTTRRDGLRVLYRVADLAVFEILDRAADIVRAQGADIAEAVSHHEASRST